MVFTAAVATPRIRVLYGERTRHCPEAGLNMSERQEPLTAQLFDDTHASTLDPFAIFQEWLETARQSEINDPNAMALASVDQSGMPDIRMVLLNGLDSRGFVFFTNFESAKGKQLQARPKAALLFHWKSIRRQVRIRGAVEIVSGAEADAYFATRPVVSRLGAHASDQSRPLDTRETLLARVEALRERFEGEEVPRPSHWSGFRVWPEQIEFWKDGEFRLHDRVVFNRASKSEGWTNTRLYP